MARFDFEIIGREGATPWFNGKTKLDLDSAKEHAKSLIRRYHPFEPEAEVYVHHQGMVIGKTCFDPTGSVLKWIDLNYSSDSDE